MQMDAYRMRTYVCRWMRTYMYAYMDAYTYMYACGCVRMNAEDADELCMCVCVCACGCVYLRPQDPAEEHHHGGDRLFGRVVEGRDVRAATRASAPHAHPIHTPTFSSAGVHS